MKTESNDRNRKPQIMPTKAMQNDYIKKIKSLADDGDSIALVGLVLISRIDSFFKNSGYKL